MRKEKNVFILFLVVAILGVANLSIHADTGSNTVPDPIYGVTLDDVNSSNIDQTVKAIQKMSVKPTVRVVMTTGTSAESYASVLSKLHKVAYIMLCPCDSTDMPEYPTVEAYHAHFADCVKHLAPYVDIW